MGSSCRSTKRCATTTNLRCSLLSGEAELSDDVVRIVAETIDVERVEAAVRCEPCGGIVTFLGIVRSHADDGRPVSGLVYEAYEPMALAELEAIAGEARARFGALRVSIVHRLGALRVGEVAVAIAVSAEHREAAFDACEYAIDELKRRAHIWKKELYADGAEGWKPNAQR
jgi:molybdopterin synthase catalytic subunit